MKYVRVVFLLWIVLCTILFGIAIDTNPATHTRTFCAYNRLFVEFDDNGKRWGTLLLDREGRPILCEEDSLPREKAFDKGII